MGANGLADERAFDEMKRLCYAGLDPGTLLRRTIERLGRVVPFAAYSVGTLDPVSGLPTQTIYDDSLFTPEEARFFVEHIYFDDHVSEYGWMVENRLPVVPLSEATGGKLERALRHREFNAPLKGFGYEMRGVFTVEGRPWGGLCIVREKGDPDFDEREIAFVERVAPHLGAGLRAAVLWQQAAYEEPDDHTPGVLILDHRWRVTHYTPAAERLLCELGGFEERVTEGWREGKELPLAVWSVAMALRQALGENGRDSSRAPRLCVQARSGRWLALQASLTEPLPGSPAETVVVVAPAGPQEVLKLRTATYGLSAREKEVFDLVLRGYSTRQIMAALHISESTVHGHLQNVFEKAGVRSRRELLKRLFLDNLLPDR